MRDSSDPNRHSLERPWQKDVNHHAGKRSELWSAHQELTINAQRDGVDLSFSLFDIRDEKRNSAYLPHVWRNKTNSLASLELPNRIRKCVTRIEPNLRSVLYGKVMKMWRGNWGWGVKEMAQWLKRSCRRLELASQHPCWAVHNYTYLQFPRVMTPSSGLWKYCTHVHISTHTRTQLKIK